MLLQNAILIFFFFNYPIGCLFGNAKVFCIKVNSYVECWIVCSRPFRSLKCHHQYTVLVKIRGKLEIASRLKVGKEGTKKCVEVCNYFCSEEMDNNRVTASFFVVVKP